MYHTGKMRMKYKKINYINTKYKHCTDRKWVRGQLQASFDKKKETPIFFYIIDFFKVNCFTRVAQLGDSISCQKSQVSHIHDKRTAKIHVGHILSLRD